MAQWRNVPGLHAAQHQALAVLDANKFSRATARMLDEVEKLCAAVAPGGRTLNLTVERLGPVHTSS